MTSLLSAKKRAEEFAAVVDGDADGATLRPEMRALVGVVSGLQREAEVGAELRPRPEFALALRERLMAEAVTSLPQDNILTLPDRRKGSRERRIALVASSIVLVGGTAGMAAAAQNALPGEALYPIKRGLEKAQAGLATNQTDRGQDLLAQADSRLVEVQGLVDSSANLTQVPATIDDFTQQATEASALLLDSYEAEQDPAIIEELRTFTADSLDELREIAKTAPAEHQDELAAAADVLLQIDERAQSVCPTCASDLTALKMPPLFLTANEARHAMAALGHVKIDNSHPVITDEGAPTTAASGDKSSTDGDGGTTEPPAQPVAPEGTDGTDGAGDTGGTDGDQGLPGDVDASGPDVKLPDKVKEGADDLGGKVKDALPDDLDPLVDTLLP